MGYHANVKQIRHDTGLTGTESQEVLGRLVEEIAERLEMDERMEFARELPTELLDVVYAAHGPVKNQHPRDIIDELMEKEHISHDRAEAEVKTACSVLKSIMSGDIIWRIRAQLPDSTSRMLA